MLNVAAQGIASDDDAIRRLLLSRAGDAHRLAAWILHDAATAEDAVQEAALLAWERRRDLRRAETADAWFTRILVNVCRQELRRRAKRRTVRERPRDDGADDDGRDAGDALSDRLADGRWIADRSAVRDELGAAIVRLDPDEQILLGLRYGRDLTVPQIADVTGMPEGTVKSRLHYALGHLRAELEAERRRGEALR